MEDGDCTTKKGFCLLLEQHKMNKDHLVMFNTCFKIITNQFSDTCNKQKQLRNADEYWKQFLADDAPLSLVKFLEDQQKAKICFPFWANPASDKTNIF